MPVLPSIVWSCTEKRIALVAGASGLAGRYMLAHLLEQGGWDIVAVSRHKPRTPGDYRHTAVDLLDPADCRTKLRSLTNISHLFYLAITERPEPGETVLANAKMCSSTSSRSSRPLHPRLSMALSSTSIFGSCRRLRHYGREPDQLLALQRGSRG